MMPRLVPSGSASAISVAPLASRQTSWTRRAGWVVSRTITAHVISSASRSACAPSSRCAVAAPCAVCVVIAAMTRNDPSLVMARTT
jgi:hypothetical protein